MHIARFWPIHSPSLHELISLHPAPEPKLASDFTFQFSKLTIEMGGMFPFRYEDDKVFSNFSLNFFIYPKMYKPVKLGSPRDLLHLEKVRLM